ncbi:MAG: hypothetical protein LC641_13965, partial [Spirochaeta sp.]|nr:hypothetical protein [Spirochaeta sp.]
MRVPCCFFALVFVLAAASASGSPEIDLHLLPQVVSPLGFAISDGPDLYQTGGGARVGALYSPRRMPSLKLGGDVGVDVIGTQHTDASLTMIGLHGALGYSRTLSGTLQVGPVLYAGYTQSIWDSSSEGQASVGADLMLGWRLTPSISLSAGGGYIQRVGLFEGARIFIGSTYGLGRSSREPFTPTDIWINPIFPILYQHYEIAPLGLLTLKNDGSDTLSDVRVSFMVNNYMDAPRLCTTVERMRRGEELTVDLHALFNNSILRVTEGERVSVNLTVQYTALGTQFSQTITETLVIHNRNALT